MGLEPVERCLQPTLGFARRPRVAPFRFASGPVQFFPRLGDGRLLQTVGGTQCQLVMPPMLERMPHDTRVRLSCWCFGGDQIRELLVFISEFSALQSAMFCCSFQPHAEVTPVVIRRQWARS